MSKEKFPHLFEPMELDGKTLRNRVLYAPLSVNYADEAGYVTPEMIEHYGRRAQGGAAMVITENIAINESGRQYPKQALIADDSFLPGLARLAEEIKKHGALAVVQVLHGGRYAGPWEEYGKRRRLSPSAVPFPLLGGTVTPQEITRDEIRETIEAFGTAARLAREAGFDGIELHGASGFLISAFMSPRMNHRTDEYGGSFENRVQFALEAVAETKRQGGPDLIVGFHLMSDELMPGGWTVQDSVELAKRLEEAGVHFIYPVSATFESLRAPEQKGLQSHAMFQLREAVVIKEAVRIPVISNGRLGDPFVAQHVLERGEADAIALGRYLLTDPDWVSKVEAGRTEEVTVCPCDPPVCIQTQRTGTICASWPDEAKEQGYLGYTNVPWYLGFNDVVIEETRGDREPGAGEDVPCSDRWWLRNLWEAWHREPGSAKLREARKRRWTVSDSPQEPNPTSTDADEPTKDPVQRWKVTVEQAAASPIPEGERSAPILAHGSMLVKYYAPHKIDEQTPHTRDELYVVISGRGTFTSGEDRYSFGPGDVLFVPAKTEHRFEGFTDDFATWVFFYGPEGGEEH